MPTPSFWVTGRRSVPKLPVELSTHADDVALVYPGIALRELDSAMRAARLPALERQARDQAGERIRVREQPLEAFGAPQGSRERPDRVAGLGGRRLEAPVGRFGRRSGVRLGRGGGRRPRPQYEAFGQ